MAREPGHGLLVIVPAWNEEATVGQVVDEIVAQRADADVVVVSDGSTDHTSAVAERHGAAVLNLPLNLGVGGAMRTGYLYAWRRGYTTTVQIDADGQHDPVELGALLEVLARDEADVVIGARFAGGGEYRAHGPRRWAMWVLSTTLSRVAHTPLTDTTSGFKACNRKAIELFARTYPTEYLGDTVESLVVASRAGLRIRQVPVAMRPRAGGVASHGPVRSSLFLARAVLALFVALTRPRGTEAGRPLA